MERWEYTLLKYEGPAFNDDDGKRDKTITEMVRDLLLLSGNLMGGGG